MYFNTGKEQRIQNVDSRNNTITLSDNSNWKVVGIYTYKIATWLAISHKAVVSQSGIGFKMTNTSKGETVDVEQIG